MLTRRAARPSRSGALPLAASFAKGGRELHEKAPTDLGPLHFGISWQRPMSRASPPRMASTRTRALASGQTAEDSARSPWRRGTRRTAADGLVSAPPKLRTIFAWSATVIATAASCSGLAALLRCHCRRTHGCRDAYERTDGRSDLTASQARRRIRRGGRRGAPLPRSGRAPHGVQCAA